MNKIILLLFIVNQLCFIYGLKCYVCKGDCKDPKEEECKGTCCFSSETELGANDTDATTTTTTPAPARIRRALGDSASSGAPWLVVQEKLFADEPKHKHKGCCDDKTKDICKEPGCYTCEKDLCNKGDTSASILGVAASPLLILPAALFLLAKTI